MMRDEAQLAFWIQCPFGKYADCSSVLDITVEIYEDGQVVLIRGAHDRMSTSNVALVAYRQIPDKHRGRNSLERYEVGMQ